MRDAVLAGLVGHGYAGSAAAPTAVIAAPFRSGRAAEALRGFHQDRFARCGPLIARAVERGEAPAGTDAGAVARAVYAPLFLRPFITHEPVGAAVADEAAEATLAAVAAGAHVRPSTPALSARRHR